MASTMMVSISPSEAKGTSLAKLSSRITEYTCWYKQSVKDMQLMKFSLGQPDPRFAGQTYNSMP